MTSNVFILKFSLLVLFVPYLKGKANHMVMFKDVKLCPIYRLDHYKFTEDMAKDVVRNWDH